MKKRVMISFLALFLSAATVLTSCATTSGSSTSTENSSTSRTTSSSTKNTSTTRETTSNTTTEATTTTEPTTTTTQVTTTTVAPTTTPEPTTVAPPSNLNSKTDVEIKAPYNPNAFHIEDMWTVPNFEPKPVTSGEAVENQEEHLYWRTYFTGMELAVAELVYQALLAGRTSVDIGPALGDHRFTEDPIGTFISQVVYTVKDGDPRFFYYEQEFNYEYTYYNHGDIWTFPTYTLQFKYKDEFSDEAVRKKAWEDMNTIAWEVADAINAASDNLLVRYSLALTWTVQHMYYDETDNRFTNNAHSALIDHITMCVGYALAYQMLANRIGGEAISVYGYAQPVDPEVEGEYHNWNMVKLGDSWYHLDPTWSDTSSNGSQFEHDLMALPLQTYFLRSEENILTHEVYTPAYPEANKDIEGLRPVAKNREELVKAVQDFFATYSPDKNQSIGMYMDVEFPLDNDELRDIIQEAYAQAGVRYGARWNFRVELGVMSFQLFPPQ